MSKVIYKSVGSLVTVEDLIHLNMGYDIKIVDVSTYEEYVDNPLFRIGENENDNDNDNEEDILI